MKTPSVIKTPRKRSGTGAFGIYYKINDNIGVKVIRHQMSMERIEEEYLDFLNQMKNNRKVDSFDSTLYEAASELVALQMLEPSGMTPKPFGLCWVKKKEYYNIGILMEHINGEPAAEYYMENSYKKVDSMESNYKKKWGSQYGIRVSDWHDFNIIVREEDKQLIRIDFSEELFSVSKEFWKEFIQRVQYEVISLIERLPND